MMALHSSHVQVFIMHAALSSQVWLVQHGFDQAWNTPITLVCAHLSNQSMFLESAFANICTCAVTAGHVV